MEVILVHTAVEDQLQISITEKHLSFPRGLPVLFSNKTARNYDFVIVSFNLIVFTCL